MTNEHKAAETDAKDVDLREAERVADLWLALALRKLARDPEAINSALRHVTSNRIIHPEMTPEDSMSTALRGIADYLERA